MWLKPSEGRNNSREPVLPIAILAPENLWTLSTSKISREGIGVCPLLYRIDFFVNSYGTRERLDDVIVRGSFCLLLVPAMWFAPPDRHLDAPS